MRHRLMSRHRATGLTMPAAQAEVMYSAGSGAERRRMTAELVERGELIPVAVEGLAGTRYIVANELELLEDDSPVPSAVSFLPALDPLMWDRRQLRELWGFDYLWEVYVPEARRRWGYYVLPILFGDRFVGRWEPRVERKTGTLRVLGLWWEEDFSPRQDPAFVPAMREAVTAYMEFTGASRVEWPSYSLGRLIGQPSRRRQRSRLAAISSQGANDR